MPVKTEWHPFVEGINVPPFDTPIWVQTKRDGTHFGLYTQSQTNAVRFHRLWPSPRGGYGKTPKGQITFWTLAVLPDGFIAALLL